LAFISRDQKRKVFRANCRPFFQRVGRTVREKGGVAGGPHSARQSGERAGWVTRSGQGKRMAGEMVGLWQDHGEFQLAGQGLSLLVRGQKGGRVIRRGETKCRDRGKHPLARNALGWGRGGSVGGGKDGDGRCP